MPAIVDGPGLEHYIAVGGYGIGVDKKRIDSVEASLDCLCCVRRSQCRAPGRKPEFHPIIITIEVSEAGFPGRQQLDALRLMRCVGLERIQGYGFGRCGRVQVG